jgi:hypothetical protein
MTRGQDGSLGLSCVTLPFTTPRRFIPAHSATCLDRGYINSTLVDAVLAKRGKIVCKPWKSHIGRLVPKSAFTLNIRDRTIACPNGHVQAFSFGTVVEFDPEACDRCALRAQCTTAEFGSGRSVAIAENEPLQQRLRKQIRTAAGRAALRERTMIEHKLAHISQRQGNAARYVGVRNNTFDLRRASAIPNLETLHLAEAQAHKHPSTQAGRVMTLLVNRSAL